MKAREIYDSIRKQKTNKLNLNLRLTLAVAVEMVACILLAYAIDWLLRDWELPLIVELLVVCLVLGSGATSLISKIFMAPIKKLCKAMERVADGDFSVHLDTESSSKEIREVCSGFNMMVNELAATEILQTDFVSNVSHEFKTPINAIEGYSMLLNGSDNLDEEQQRYVEKILFNTRRLSSLVGSILLLSKLENQSIPTNQSRYRLDEQIRQSVVALEPAWEKKDIEFDVELDSIEYTGNETMMRHVWDNLIGNAIKFDPLGGMVCIRLKKEENSIVVTIDDSGPGISEEEKKHLFDKFYQGDSSHKEEGNGLGLSLVKKILAVENGSISAENIPGGCRFTVILDAK